MRIIIRRTSLTSTLTSTPSLTYSILYVIIFTFASLSRWQMKHFVGASEQRRTTTFERSASRGSNRRNVRWQALETQRSGRRLAQSTTGGVSGVAPAATTNLYGANPQTYQAPTQASSRSRKKSSVVNFASNVGKTMKGWFRKSGASSSSSSHLQETAEQRAANEALMSEIRGSLHHLHIYDALPPNTSQRSTATTSTQTYLPAPTYSAPGYGRGGYSSQLILGGSVNTSTAAGALVPAQNQSFPVSSSSGFGNEMAERPFISAEGRQRIVDQYQLSDVTTVTFARGSDTGDVDIAYRRPDRTRRRTTPGPSAVLTEISESAPALEYSTAAASYGQPQTSASQSNALVTTSTRNHRQRQTQLAIGTRPTNRNSGRGQRSSTGHGT